MTVTDTTTLAYSPMPAGYEPGYTDRVLQEHHGSELAQLDQALEQFEAAQQGLLNQAGQELYAPDEHERRLAAHRASAEETFAKVERAAAAAQERNDRTLTALNADPLNGLTQAERADAASRAPFIERYCARTPLVPLRDRVAAVELGNNRAEAFVYALGIEERLRGLAEQMNRSGRDPGSLPADERQAAGELHQALERLRERVQGTDAKETQAAALRRAQAALALQGRINEARAVVGSQAPALDTAYARHLWSGRR